MNSGRRGTRNPRVGRLAVAGALSHPPQIHPAISGSKKFRFTASGGADVQSVITQTNLANLLVVATSAVTTSRIFSSVRLRRVEAWCLPAQGLTSQLLSIAGTGAGPENRKSDASMGVTPAHVVWSPAPLSVADLWFEVGGTLSMFQLTAPGASIVDVTLDFIQNCEDASTAGPVPAGATAGVWYGCTLDGNGLTGSMLPVDYLTLP
jgi:hypothetical protein